jgi:hypothetical protein
MEPAMSRAVLGVWLLVLFALGSGCGFDAAPSPTATVEPRDSQSSNAEDAPDVSAEPAPVPLEPGQVSLADKDRRFALLVGCSKYEHLSEAEQLRGPTNDVALMKSLLVKQFGMAEANIQALTQEAGEGACKPIKENIAREFRRITQQLREGDYFVFYFSGHGCQQLDDDFDPQVDPEPDGLDEVLLPADVGASEESEEEDDGRIRNAISDDELRDWLTAMRGRGASVWAIVDACHSGSVTRGSHEVARQVRPESLLSPKALETMRSRVSVAATSSKATGANSADEHTGGIVAVYAAQPDEPTFEMQLPDEEHGQWQGLLTYTMAKILMEAEEPLNYAELMQRIQNEYVVTGRFGPTPLVEGTDRNREVLGSKAWGDRGALALGIDGKKMTVNAGRLHGLSPGSILAVHAPVGQKSEDQGPLGYVKVRAAYALISTVDSTEFLGLPAARDLPQGGRCEVAHVDYGELRLKVGIGASVPEGDARTAWSSALRALSAEPQSTLMWVEEPEEADWLVDFTKLGRGVLAPAQQSPGGPRFGPIPADASSAAWFKEHLARISRAQNLLRIAGTTRSSGQRGLFSSLLRRSKLKVDSQLMRLDSPEDEEPDVVPWKAEGITLLPETLLSLELFNEGEVPADVTVLFIDSNFGISCLFPQPDTVVDNRIPEGDSLTVGPMRVEGNSLGWEHLLVIATSGEGDPLDFSWLAQPSLERARSGESWRPSQQSPLGQLLEHAAFGAGATRGLRPGEVSEVSFRCISWRTVAGPALRSATP